MTDTNLSSVDMLVGKKPKLKPKDNLIVEPVDNPVPQLKEPIEPTEPELQMEAPERTKKDKISDEILDVMLVDNHLEKMTDLTAKSALVFARADTMAEIFNSKTLAKFTKKAKQHLVSNKRLGRTEISDVLTNVGDTAEEPETLKSKLFGGGDNF